MLAYCALAQRSPVPLACLQDAASLSNSTQYNAALGVSSIKEWMPHDVAEWLYMQSTKEDYTHTFLVHNIDGPALLGLTREQMLEWKVKHADVQVILKGVVDLRRIAEGNIGWQPCVDDQVGEHVQLPTAPKMPPSKPPPPRKKPKPKPAAAPASPRQADGGEVSEGAAPAPPAADTQQTFSLTAVPGEASTGSKPLRRSADAGQASMTSLGTAGSLKVNSPSYLKKMMGELHNDRVPLWKEEMIERVNRAATAREAHAKLKTMALQSAPHSALNSARLSSSSRRLRADDGSEMSASASRSGVQSARGPESVADDAATEIQFNSAQAKEIERKLFWYQDAINEQELQQQLLDQKIEALLHEEASLLARRASDPMLMKSGAAGLEKELNRRQQREKSRLTKALQVTEERVADAERLNKATVENINQMRRGRALFLEQTAKLEERVNAMVADMKHFSVMAHANLDEKEKIESRLKRQRYEYSNEIAHTEHVFEMLANELQTLDEKIAHTNAEEDKLRQAERQNAFRSVRQQREDDQRRELRLGFLQNHVRGLEMDFQRLHRIMGVKFSPDKPESVHEIVQASLSHEQRNSSLLYYVDVQNRQIEEAEEQLQQLVDDEAALLVKQAKGREVAVVVQAKAKAEVASVEAIERLRIKREADLLELCPVMQRLLEQAGGSPQQVPDGGMLALKGCRPDTLTDFLRLLDVRVKELHQHAESLPTALGSEWLRDFLRPKEVRVNPTGVMDLRRELEAAAQKQREAKEAMALQDGHAEEEPTLSMDLPPPRELANP